MPGAPAILPADAALLLLAELMEAQPPPFNVTWGRLVLGGVPAGVAFQVNGGIVVAVSPSDALAMAGMIEDVTASMERTDSGASKDDWLALATACRQEAEAILAGKPKESTDAQPHPGDPEAGR